MTTKSWKNYPQKLLRIPQIHFFSLLPWLPKQKNSCSKMWIIDQLYIELGFWLLLLLILTRCPRLHELCACWFFSSLFRNQSTTHSGPFYYFYPWFSRTFKKCLNYFRCKVYEHWFSKNEKVSSLLVCYVFAIMPGRKIILFKIHNRFHI